MLRVKTLQQLSWSCHPYFRITYMNVPAVLVAALMGSAASYAQILMTGLEQGGRSQLFPSDAAVLDMREVRSSLPCEVKPLRPELGFDLAFHAGYDVRLRLRDVAGDGDLLTTIFRVTPNSTSSKSVYFEQKWRVPAIPENAGGVTTLGGFFNVGEGDYQVDWLMRDRQERVCSAYWKVSTRPPVKWKEVPAGLTAGTVAEATNDEDAELETSKDSTGQQLTVAILLNISPHSSAATRVSPEELQALFSILRGIARDPRIGAVSMTAFSLDQRQVLFQQESGRRISLSAIYQAADALNFGTVSVGQLAERNAAGRFLVQLAAERVRRNPLDAVIFIGPQAVDYDGHTRDLTRELLDQLGEAACPVFYLNYNTAPEVNPWRDLIGSAVRYWKGHEFRITKPLDLLSAWSRIMSRLVSNRR
jgi:hypothetical protein